MRWVLILALVALASPVTAQELPKPTEDGRKALDNLIRRCVAGGGLKSTRDDKTGAMVLSLGDPAALRAAVAADPAALTPALRDTLIAHCGEWDGRGGPVVFAVLQTVGEVARDDRVLAEPAAIRAQALATSRRFCYNVTP